jgi:hypothetical protein
VTRPSSLRALVEKIEWRGTYEHVEGCCAFCFNFKHEGHEEGCEMAELLASLLALDGTTYPHVYAAGEPPVPKMLVKPEGTPFSPDREYALDGTTPQMETRQVKAVCDGCLNEFTVTVQVPKRAPLALPVIAPTETQEDLRSENQRLRDGLQYLGEAVNPIAEARDAAWRRVAELETLIDLVKKAANNAGDHELSRAITAAVDATMDAAEILAGAPLPVIAERETEKGET